MAKELINYQNWNICLTNEDDRFYFQLTNGFGDSYITNNCVIYRPHHYKSTNPLDLQQEAQEFLMECFSNIATHNKRFDIEVIRNEQGEYHVLIGQYGLKGGVSTGRILGFMGGIGLIGAGVAATIFSGGVAAIPLVAAYMSEGAVIAAASAATGAGISGAGYSMTAKKFSAKEYASQVAVGAATSVVSGAIGSVAKGIGGAAKTIKVVKETAKVGKMAKAVGFVKTAASQAATGSATSVGVKVTSVVVEAGVKGDKEILKKKLTGDAIVKEALMGAACGSVTKAASHLASSSAQKVAKTLLKESEIAVVAKEVIVEASTQSCTRGAVRATANVCSGEDVLKGVKEDMIIGACVGAGSGIYNGANKVHKMRVEKQEKEKSAIAAQKEIDRQERGKQNKETATDKKPKKIESSHTKKESGKIRRESEEFDLDQERTDELVENTESVSKESVNKKDALKPQILKERHSSDQTDKSGTALSKAKKGSSIASQGNKNVGNRTLTSKGKYGSIFNKTDLRAIYPVEQRITALSNVKEIMQHMAGEIRRKGGLSEVEKNHPDIYRKYVGIFESMEKWAEAENSNNQRSVDMALNSLFEHASSQEPTNISTSYDPRHNFSKNYSFKKMGEILQNLESTFNEKMENNHTEQASRTEDQGQISPSYVYHRPNEEEHEEVPIEFYTGEVDTEESMEDQQTRSTFYKLCKAIAQAIRPSQTSATSSYQLRG